jgi:hypothetical protein
MGQRSTSAASKKLSKGKGHSSLAPAAVLSSSRLDSAAPSSLLAEPAAGHLDSAREALESSEFGDGSSGHRQDHGQWLRLYRLALTATITFIALLLLQQPIATNDGPVHVQFSHLMLTLRQANHPLQSHLYTLKLKLNPNLAVYLLMSSMMRIFSPELTESIVQLLCIAGLVWSGYFALKMVDSRNAWLSIFLLPLAFNQMFFLGLYNHCLSLAAFFLALGTYYWMNKSPSLLRAVALSGALILTFFCHASGFIMTFMGIGVITATAAAMDFARHRRIFQALRRQRFALAAMLAPLPLAAIFLASGEKSSTLYGVELGKRIKQVLQIRILASNYPVIDRFPGWVMSVLLLSAFALTTFRLIRNRSGHSLGRQSQALGTVLATAVAFLIALTFPDTMGGGWTHFRRFEIFPFFWILLVLAFERFSARVIGAFVAVGAIAAAILSTSLFQRQAMIHEQMAPLAEVDRLVGDHCTVLPITLNYRPVVWNALPAWMDYQPFFQSANRLELHGDRVVLFNYLARLTPYPIHFRPEAEPQAHIFHWRPAQSETVIEQVDVEGFERSSGVPADYVLLWGSLQEAKPAMQSQVTNTIRSFSPIYRSANGRVTLYHRIGAGNGFCQVKDGSTNLAKLN